MALDNTGVIAISVVLILLGSINIALVSLKAVDNWYYTLLRDRAGVCTSDESKINTWIVVQGVLLIIFGVVLGIVRLL